MLRWIVTSLTGLLTGWSLLLAATAPPPDEIVTLDQPPQAVQVGVPFTVSFTISAPEVPEAAPLVVASHAASGAMVRVAARPARAPGHYAAMLILPSAGQWNWEIYPQGEGRGAGVAMAPLEVIDSTARTSLGLWPLATVIAMVTLAPMVVVAWAMLTSRTSQPAASTWQ